jgi:hypothetical protein
MKLAKNVNIVTRQLSAVSRYFFLIRFKSRRMRRAGHEARMGDKRNVYRLLVGKPEGRRPLGRPRSRWIV